MRAGPANAVHAVAAPEITARVTQPVCAVPAPMRIGLLTVSRGGIPNPTRSIADGPDQAPGPNARQPRRGDRRPRPLHRRRRKTLHP
jgi:hypothetical protein